MPVTYDEKSKNLPGYMQVYEEELKVKFFGHITTTVTATEDKSMHTFMIRYTPEGTFREKRSPFTIFGNSLMLVPAVVILLILAIGMLSGGEYIAAAVPAGLLLLILARILLIHFDTSGRSTVCIDATGISLPKMSYKWEEMAGTFIVSRYQRKHVDTFLVLALGNGHNVYFPLAAFANNGPKFATAIKHLKPVTTSVASI